MSTFKSIDLKDQVQSSQSFLDKLKDEKMKSFLEGVKLGSKNPLEVLKIPYMKKKDYQNQNENQNQKYKQFISDVKEIFKNSNNMNTGSCKKGGYITRKKQKNKKSKSKSKSKFTRRK
jgi:hypothetical protein